MTTTSSTGYIASTLLKELLLCLSGRLGRLLEQCFSPTWLCIVHKRYLWGFSLVRLLPGDSFSPFEVLVLPLSRQLSRFHSSGLRKKDLSQY